MLLRSRFVTKNEQGHWIENAGFIENPIQLCYQIAFHPNVTVVENTPITSLKKNTENNTWTINECLSADQVVVCTGSFFFFCHLQTSDLESLKTEELVQLPLLDPSLYIRDDGAKLHVEAFLFLQKS